jgi:hypothetical protein
MPGTLGLRVGGAARAAALGTLVAVPLALLGPPAGDLPAHLYRTELVEDGVFLWDTFWYVGHYPLASYSLLYYFPAALVGNELLAVLAVIAAAALFASVVERRWRERARPAALAFAVVAAGPLFTGTYPYAVGLATLLGALAALQRGRTWLAILLSAATLGASPLAFLFLCIVLAAIFLLRRRLDRRSLAVGGAVVGLGLFQGALLLLFPLDGRYPFFRVSELLVVVALAGLACALAWRVPEGRVVGIVFALWALASAIAFVVTSPIGENVTRLRGVVLPLVLLAAGLARWRPRALAALATAGALAYTLVPYLAVIPHRTDGRPAKKAFWAPALAFLRAHADPNSRVEVVPTVDHWEAYWIPRSGLPLARGWYRQLDIAQNPLFYREPLEAAAYREWLRSRGIRYVLLPDTGLGRMGEEREAELLRTGAAGLTAVFRSPTGTIYELERPTPILSGPGPARLTLLDHERVVGEVGGRGRYRLAVRWTPWWRVEGGAVCVREAADGMTTVVAHAAGTFELGVGIPGRGGCAGASS